MKNINLILCFFCFSSVSAAQLNETTKSWERVSAGGEQICALGEGSVKCWGWNSSGSTDVHKLKNPIQVSVGYSHSCALDDEGVKCWGRNDYGQTDVPKLQNPRQVSAGGDRTCALDDEGVKCWGWNDNGPTDVPKLKNPHQVSAGYFQACALDDEGVKCWGWSNYGKSYVSNLKNPRQVSAGRDTACALDDEGVKCWDRNSYAMHAYLLKFKNPRQVSVGDRNICALGDEGVTCWNVADGYETWVTKLKNPRQVSTAFEHACALDDEGVTCWGDYRIFRLSSDHASEFFGKYLNLAIESSVYSKSTFLKPLEKFHIAEIGVTSLDLDRLFLLASIVSPAVLGTNSDYFKTDVIPRLNAFVTWLKIWSSRPLDQDPIPKVEANLENLTLALTAIQASLDVSLSFLSGKQIDRAQDALRKVGQAMIDPMNDQNVLEAVKSVESLTEERAVLLSSDKSKFLIECQQVAIDWLKLKVK